MNWLKKFMYGRYGVDQLSLALIILSVFFSLIAVIINNSFVSLIPYIPIFLCYFRILSKNRAKRQQENYLFLRYWNPIKNEILKKFNRLKGMRTHKYYKCPNCSQSLRVPKGKVNISITCPKCKTSFSKRT